MVDTILEPNVVHCAVAPGHGYDAAESVAAPELPSGRASTAAAIALRQLLRHAGLDRARYGTAEWKPLREIVRAGASVLLKPNWVLHENHSGSGLESLVTHVSVIESFLPYLAQVRPGRVVIGDAPVQGCDFHALATAVGIDEIVERYQRTLPDLVVRDFRLTELVGARSWSRLRETGRSAADYVQFDLGCDSLLEPLAGTADRLRVTMYDPGRMQETHAPGRHRYLIAREALEAEVVFNLPKLKTHKKAAITGALKNAVGINGSKASLPHHRKGNSTVGGDCYRERSLIKSWAEDVLDAMNHTDSRVARYSLAKLVSTLKLYASSLGQDVDFEGSWYGNDTVWRMSLDIQRILHYGRADGGLADAAQRAVLTLTDAIVAGEGEGPLAPTPVPLGLLTFGINVAALEWAHAGLMGLDPMAVPIVREAFSQFRYPLATFSPSDVSVVLDGTRISPEDLARRHGRAFLPPKGWRQHCEKQVSEKAAC
ncbi:MAG: DUF362 domain-containing protein [Acidobacteriia bacterium]|nr:DUF362 domain-containing protein [Terriglobia bacterium]